LRKSATRTPKLVEGGLYERRLSALREFTSFSRRKTFAEERARPSSAPVDSGRPPIVGAREILQTPARRHQLARERERCRRCRVRARAREPLEDAEVVRCSRCADDDVVAAELAELGPDRGKVRCASDIAVSKPCVRVASIGIEIGGFTSELNSSTALPRRTRTAAISTTWQLSGSFPSFSIG